MKTLKKNENRYINKYIKIDGEYFTKFSKMNLTHLKTQSKLISSCVELLTKCHDTTLNNNKKTGLIIGKVQSGKTTFFLSAIAMAFDNRFNIAIVFTGTKNNLKNQTYYRMKKNFNNENFTKLKFLDSSDFLQDDKLDIEEFSKQINLNINTGNKIIIIGLKHYLHIESIQKILNEVDSNCDYLIIDDEGDQASLNNKVNKREKSATYQAFINLRNHLQRVTFISVTATPQANLFIDTYDYISPDFCVLIEPGDGYTGAKVFHDELESQLIKIIPDVDKEDLIDNRLPESLKEAIMVFIIGSAIGLYRDGNSKFSMLVHPSSSMKDHKNAEKIIKDHLQNLKEIFTYDEEDALFHLEKNLFKDTFEKMSQDFEYDCKFEDIFMQILEIIKMIYIQVINSAEDYQNSLSSLYNYKIFIGGNMVERGLTIDSLSVTYITRHPKGKGNVDTVEQRARWFGYKQEYIDLCRVYCTEDIKVAMSSILSHEDDLWENLNYANRYNLNLKDYTLSVILDNDNLNITRKSVLPKSTTAIKYLGHLNQKKFLEDLNVQKCYSEYINNLFKNQKTVEIKHKNYQIDLMRPLNHMEFADVIKFMDDNNIIQETKLKNWLKHILRREETVKIYLMRYKNEKGLFESTRSFRKDGTIINLSQGKSLRGREVYPGDISVYEKELHIQFHMIHPKNMLRKFEVVPYISVNIPIHDGMRIVHRGNYNEC